MLRKLLNKLGRKQPSSLALQGSADQAPVSKSPVASTAAPASAWPADKSRMCGLADAVQTGWYQSETGELFKGFPIRPEDTVLDVGCGEGGATMFCAKQGAHVVFSDMERDKVEDLERRVVDSPARKHEALVCDTNPLPLADNYASRVIAIEMLEHTESPDVILSELRRVGKPGALYLITVPDPVAEKLQQGIAPDEYFQSPNHVRIFERDEFEDTVTRAGLEIVHRTSYSFYWSMWMLFFWVTEAAAGNEFDGAILDKINPPYHPLLESWASTWQLLMRMPQGLELKETLDNFMPKAQVIIARKPE